MKNPSIALRQMTPDDLEVGARLVEITGWNQLPVDWSRWQALEPHGCFVGEVDGVLRGTVTTICHGDRCGWIGMVLVDPDVRRCGLGTKLLLHGLDYLSSRVATIKLDATPLGKHVYDRNGFVVESELERWEGVAPATTQRRYEPLRAQDLDAVIAFDAPIFGAERAPLLRALYADAPQHSAVAWCGGAVTGYAMGRPGRLAHYLGPWVAEDAATARGLADSILADWQGKRYFVDLNLANEAARDAVADYNLTLQRPLIRMYRGANAFPGEPSQVFGIAGPEVG